MTNRSHQLSLLLCLVLVLQGCVTPYAPPQFEPQEESSHQFPGLLPLARDAGSLHVIWIHGMCPHSRSDWADVRVRQIADLIGASPVAGEPIEGSRDIAFRYPLVVDGIPVTIDMIVWNDLIAEQRQALCFDSQESGGAPAEQSCGDSASNEHHRAWANNLLKSSLMNACLADAVTYLGEAGGEVRSVVRTAIERALTTRSSGQDPKLVLISESLGSKVMMDVLLEIMQDTEPATKAVRSAITSTVQLFLLANQIPLLDLAAPRLVGSRAPNKGATGNSTRDFIKILTERKAAQGGARGVDAIKFVAFTDPNDILSYAMPLAYFKPNKVDVINVLVSNDSTWLVRLFENPAAAHQGYRHNESVQGLLLCGNVQDQKDCPLPGRP